MAKEAFAQFNIPLKFYGASLSEEQRQSVCASLSEEQKSALRLFWVGQGLANVEHIRKQADPALSKEFDSTLSQLEKLNLIYIAKDLNHPEDTYVMVMPQGLQIMGLLFSKRS